MLRPWLKDIIIVLGLAENTLVCIIKMSAVGVYGNQTLKYITRLWHLDIGKTFLKLSDHFVVFFYFFEQPFLESLKLLLLGKAKYRV